jgi:galactoside O-acetyltransferase
MNSFYSESKLKQLGFKSIGKNVLISKKASFYGINRIQIGDNVRIDDFCFFLQRSSLFPYTSFN